MQEECKVKCYLKAKKVQFFIDTMKSSDVRSDSPPKLNSNKWVELVWQLFGDLYTEKNSSGDKNESSRHAQVFKKEYPSNVALCVPQILSALACLYSSAEDETKEALQNVFDKDKPSAVAKHLSEWEKSLRMPVEGHTYYRGRRLILDGMKSNSHGLKTRQFLDRLVIEMHLLQLCGTKEKSAEKQNDKYFIEEVRTHQSQWMQKRLGLNHQPPLHLYGVDLLGLAAHSQPNKTLSYLLATRLMVSFLPGSLQRNQTIAFSIFDKKRQRSTKPKVSGWKIRADTQPFTKVAISQHWDMYGVPIAGKQISLMLITRNSSNNNREVQAGPMQAIGSWANMQNLINSMEDCSLDSITMPVLNVVPHRPFEMSRLLQAHGMQLLFGQKCKLGDLAPGGYLLNFQSVCIFEEEEKSDGKPVVDYCIPATSSKLNDKNLEVDSPFMLLLYDRINHLPVLFVKISLPGERMSEAWKSSQQHKNNDNEKLSRFRRDETAVGLPPTDGSSASSGYVSLHSSSSTTANDEIAHVKDLLAQHSRPLPELDENGRSRRRLISRPSHQPARTGAHHRSPAEARAVALEASQRLYQGQSCDRCWRHKHSPADHVHTARAASDSPTTRTESLPSISSRDARLVESLRAKRRMLTGDQYSTSPSRTHVRLVSTSHTAISTCASEILEKSGDLKLQEVLVQRNAARQKEMDEKLKNLKTRHNRALRALKQEQEKTRVITPKGYALNNRASSFRDSNDRFKPFSVQYDKHTVGIALSASQPNLIKSNSNHKITPHFARGISPLRHRRKPTTRNAATNTEHLLNTASATAAEQVGDRTFDDLATPLDWQTESPLQEIRLTNLDSAKVIATEDETHREENSNKDTKLKTETVPEENLPLENTPPDVTEGVSSEFVEEKAKTVSEESHAKIVSSQPSGAVKEKTNGDAEDNMISTGTQRSMQVLEQSLVTQEEAVDNSQPPTTETVAQSENISSTLISNAIIVDLVAKKSSTIPAINQSKDELVCKNNEVIQSNQRANSEHSNDQNNSQSTAADRQTSESAHVTSKSHEDESQQSVHETKIEEIHQQTLIRASKTKTILEQLHKDNPSLEKWEAEDRKKLAIDNFVDATIQESVHTLARLKATGVLARQLSINNNEIRGQVQDYLHATLFPDALFMAIQVANGDDI